MLSQKTARPVLIIGDVMEDIYLVGKGFMPQEGLFPSIKVTSSVRFDGGAGNVQANILAINPDIETMLAHNPDAVSQKVRCCVTQMSRVVARFDYDKPSPGLIALGYEQDIIDYIADKDPVVVVSDYGKGAVGVDEVNLLATRPLLVDTRDPSKYWQNGRRYDGWVFFPNYKEYEDSKLTYDNLIGNGAVVVVKRSSLGVEVHISQTSRTVHIPTLPANQPISVVGAGDVVIAAFAAVCAMRGREAEGVILGQLLASDAVTRPYTCVANIESVRTKHEEYKPIYENTLPYYLHDWFNDTWANFIASPGEAQAPSYLRNPKNRDPEGQSVSNYCSARA